MKRFFMGQLIIAVLFLGAGLSFASNVDASKNGNVIDSRLTYAVKDSHGMPMPDKYKEYLDPEQYFVATVYEYNDAVIVEKRVTDRFGDFYIRVNADALTGEANGYKWLSLSKARESRDKIYTVRTTPGGTEVVALISAFMQPSYRATEEYLVVDVIQPRKKDGKVMIMRNVVPVRYGFSDRGLAGPVPDEATMLSDNTLRLSYTDGSVEHWKVGLSRRDMEKNLEKYYTPISASLDPNDALFIKKRDEVRALVWWNEKGKGAGTQDIYRSWDYNEDSSKEPVYKDSAPKKKTSGSSGATVSSVADSPGGVFARLAGAVKGLLTKLAGLLWT
ncbi:MAG: hypothetical protein IJT95_02640 [Abditibacteriota bacterium]|nr:hypothetical protein [Abditibacteriota bacterium]